MCFQGGGGNYPIIITKTLLYPHLFYLAGVAEGILVDLAEPEQEENTENFLINTAGTVYII